MQMPGKLCTNLSYVLTCHPFDGRKILGRNNCFIKFKTNAFTFVLQHIEQIFMIEDVFAKWWRNPRWLPKGF
jgi:hypothetical protein